MCALAAARPIRGGVPVQQAVVVGLGAVSEVVRIQESVPGQNTWVPFMFYGQAFSKQEDAAGWKELDKRRKLLLVLEIRSSG